MLDINTIVQETIAGMDHEGKIKKLVEEKVASTIESVIADSFREYSDFGKGLKKYVNESLNIDFAKIGLEGYHDHIIKTISAVITKKLHGESEQKLKETLDQIIVEAPKQIKLSEIIKMMKSQFTEEASESDNLWEGMTCLVNDRESNYFRYISLDKEPGKQRYNCAYRVGLHKDTDSGKWVVFSMTIDHEDMRKNLFVGPFYRVERLLYQLHCANSEIIIDLDDYQIGELCEYELLEEEY